MPVNRMPSQKGREAGPSHQQFSTCDTANRADDTTRVQPPGKVGLNNFSVVEVVAPSAGAQGPIAFHQEVRPHVFLEIEVSQESCVVLAPTQKRTLTGGVSGGSHWEGQGVVMVWSGSSPSSHGSVFSLEVVPSWPPVVRLQEAAKRTRLRIAHAVSRWSDEEMRWAK